MNEAYEDNKSERPAAPAGTRATPHATDHLANERTFLAWIRTSLAVIGLGFAVAKFGSWLRELAGQPASVAGSSRSALSTATGILMIATGGVFAVLAAWRHRVVGRQIASGTVKSAESTVLVVTTIVFILTVAVAYLILRSAPG